MNENEQTREIYAHFGLAVYQAQVLEHAIVNAAVYLDLIPKKAPETKSSEEWTAHVDEFMGREFTKTLGRMIRTLQSITSVPPELSELLSESLKRRNWLCHAYFRERAVDFVSDVGREEMFNELREAQDLFRQTEETLEQLIRPVRTRYGFSDTKLEVYYKEFLKRSTIS